MKNLEILIAQSKADLDLLKIPYGEVAAWTINNRAKSRWGICRLLPSGQFEIQISSLLLDDSISDQVVKNTIVHELLHTVPGCFKHVGEWKHLAAVVNDSIPGYDIKRASGRTEMGLEEAEPRYLLRCQKCGQTIERNRISAVIQKPSNYSCICGGRFIRIK